MFKRFGLAGLLLAVSAIAPLSAAPQDRNYNNRNQWTPQAQHAVQVIDSRATGYNTGYNNGQNFRGGEYQSQIVRGGRNDRREPVSSFHGDRDDRYSKLRLDRDDFGRR
jgi:hypothetical protein